MIPRPRKRAPGGGRKPRAAGGTCARVTVRLSAAESAKLELAQHKLGVSSAEVLRTLLRRFRI